jgi:hypothetical protein
VLLLGLGEKCHHPLRSEISPGLSEMVAVNTEGYVSYAIEHNMPIVVIVRPDANIGALVTSGENTAIFLTYVSMMRTDEKGN